MSPPTIPTPVPGSFICIPIRKTTCWQPVADAPFSRTSPGISLLHRRWRVGDILGFHGTFHRSISDDDGSVVLNQAVRERCSLLTNSVCNSDRIRADAGDLASAPKPQLHGVEPATGGLNQIRAFTHWGCRQLLDLDAPTQITRRSGGPLKLPLTAAVSSVSTRWPEYVSRIDFTARTGSKLRQPPRADRPRSRHGGRTAPVLAPATDNH